MKKLLSKVLLILSYVWVMAFDMLIMLSVFSTVSKVVLALGVSDQITFISGMAAATLAFAHLKFRHRLRQMSKPSVMKCKCSGNQECYMCQAEEIKDTSV